jgi:hypothetical protein
MLGGRGGALGVIYDAYDGLYGEVPRPALISGAASPAGNTDGGGVTNIHNGDITHFALTQNGVTDGINAFQNAANSSAANRYPALLAGMQQGLSG